MTSLMVNDAKKPTSKSQQDIYKVVSPTVITSAKTKTFAKMVTPSQLKIGLVQVLDDQLPSPLSCREFHDFLLQEHSEENIEFYFALRDYKAICAKYPDDILRNKESEVNSAQSEVTTNDSTAVMPASSLSRSAYDLTPVEEAVTSLLNTFFLNDPPREVNVPAKILKPMFHAIQVEKNMHPEVFNASLDTILTMMRLSSFPNFYKIAAAKTDDAESNSSVTPILLSPQDKVSPTVITSAKTKTFAKMVTPSQLKIGLVQVLENQLPPPLSCQEFHYFLLQEHSEENIEFYFALREYKAMCTKYPDDILRNKVPVQPCINPVDIIQLQPSKSDSTTVIPSSTPDSNDGFQELEPPPPLPRAAYDLTPVENAMTTLLNTFFLHDPPREVNVPAKILKPMFHAIQVEKNLHPEVFNASLDTILTMMRLSSFPNFYKIAASKMEELETQKTTEGRVRSASSLGRLTPDKPGEKAYRTEGSFLGVGGGVGFFKKREALMETRSVQRVDVEAEMPEIELASSQPDIMSLLDIADGEKNESDENESDDEEMAARDPNKAAKAKKLFEKAMGVFRRQSVGSKGRQSVPVRPSYLSENQSTSNGWEHSDQGYASAQYSTQYQSNTGAVTEE